MKGSCLCGAISFVCEFPTKWCCHCHCSLCRKSHGSAFVTWFGVASEQFKFLSGDTPEELGVYHSTPDATRKFCKTCGSHLIFESQRWPGEIHLTVASLLGPLDRNPKIHVFCSDAAEWLDLPSLHTLPRHGGASGLELLPQSQ